jgi:hypothetical protein
MRLRQFGIRVSDFFRASDFGFQIDAIPRFPVDGAPPHTYRSATMLASLTRNGTRQHTLHAALKLFAHHG